MNDVAKLPNSKPDIARLILDIEDGLTVSELMIDTISEVRALLQDYGGDRGDVNAIERVLMMLESKQRDGLCEARANFRLAHEAAAGGVA